ncbi:MAG: hypothetical protein K8S99_12470 [Planctomycetes bacterium]|nr:hypothetical protein [Planctomycetota bacterium]
MTEALTNNPNLLLYAGLALLAAWGVMWFVRRYKDGRPRQERHAMMPEEKIERGKQERGAKDDLETLMIEIDDMTKRVGSRLDAKIAQVERAIREADERIAELQRVQGAGTVPQVQAPRPSPTVVTTGRTPSPPQPVTPAAEPADELSRKVYNLSDSGKSAVEISRQLREHIGKVELILALRRA